jgi:uncharacterized SAM-binding protein YcdF (DUF218 family)
LKLKTDLDLKNPNGRPPWRCLLFLLAGALVAVAVGAFMFAEDLLCVENGPPAADAIIVLGGESVGRVSKAFELFKKGAARRIIVSGSGDADFIRQQLVRAGAPRDAIELEDQSRTTKDNAEFTTRMLQASCVQRAIIVTSWFHSRRALSSFRSFAPEIQFSSLPAYYQEAFSAKATHVFQEYIKTAWYFVHYGISPSRASRS